MADKEAPTVKKAPATKKSAAPRKKAAAQNSVASKNAQEHVTVEDMHKLLGILQDGLASRDKAVDYLQQQIALDQVQIEQNKKILAKRSILYKAMFVLLAIGLVIVGMDQHSIVKSFDNDMTTVARDMDVMMKEMTKMRVAMESMSTDMHSMSGDFSTVATDVSAIAQDVKSMSHGVRGMSRDTYEMNRSMDTMTPPWSPWK